MTPTRGTGRSSGWGGRRFAFRARGRAAARRWQSSFRKALREALGLARMDRELAGWRVRARRAEVKRSPGYTRRKWYCWTEPPVPPPVVGPEPPGGAGWW